MAEEKDVYKRIRPLMAYYREYGNLDIKQDVVYQYDGKEVKIGRLIAELRRDKRNGKLSKGVTKLADLMGMSWDGKESFQDIKKDLDTWYAKHKTLQNLTQYDKIELEDGQVVDCGDALHRIRKYYKDGDLEEEEIVYLESVYDIIWEPNSPEIAFAPLVEYANKFGSLKDIKVRDVYANEQGEKYPVGRQINHLRARYNKGLLDDKEIAFFEDLGIKWSARDKSAGAEKEK